MIAFLRALFGFFSPRGVIEDELTTEPRGYRVRRSGGTVIAGVSGDGDGPIQLVFTKRIERSDVVKGRLLPTSREMVKRRGGKRLTTITLSYESAEALYQALKPALKDARRRRRAWAFMYRVIVTITHMDSGTRVAIR
jgi:hypothetical protein